MQRKSVVYMCYSTVILILYVLKFCLVAYRKSMGFFFRNRNFHTGLFNYWKNTMNLRLQLILVFITAIVRGSRSHTREDYENVLYDIFTTRGYNKDVLPRLNSSEPVYLDVSLHFTKITAIDEKNEKMTSTGYLEIHWEDPGLRWNSKDFGNLQYVYIRQEKIWVPDMFLVNGAKTFSGFGGSFYHIKVYSNGSALWLPFDVFEGSCSLATRHFPFDKQRCELIFSVWTHSAIDVQIRNSRNGLCFDRSFRKNTVWRIDSTSYIVKNRLSESNASSLTKVPRGKRIGTLANEDESNVVFTFIIVRKSLYYVMIIVLPIFLLGFLSGFVFLIPVESGEKMGYSVTVFLSQVVFLSIIESYIPISSDHVSMLQAYLLIQIMVGVLIIVVSAIEMHIHHRNDDIPVNGIFLKLAALRAKCLCWKRKIRVEDKISENEEMSNLKTKKFQVKSWQDVVRMIDSFCFWSFIILYTLINVIAVILMATRR